MDYQILRRSYLNVKGRQVKKWKKCWVKLQDNVLLYFTTEHEAPNELLEAISISDGVTVARSDKKECKEEFSFKIIQPSTKNFTPLFLAAESEAEAAEWVKEINKAESIGAQAVFGVDLSVAVKKNSQSIPVVVEKCINFLRGSTNVPGIFRVSGAQSEVLAYKTQFDKGDDVDFSGCKDPHVVSNVLKLYLRELPNPLLTAESYQKFIDANSIPADKVQDAIKQLVNALPLAHRVTLHHIMSFLTTVAAQSSENKMPSANLAIVFGPTILRPGREERFEDAGNMEIANRLTERLIYNYDGIFDPQPPPIKRIIKGHQRTLSNSGANLPDNFVEHTTPDGKMYYYNSDTKTTTWDRPAEPAKPAVPPGAKHSPTLMHDSSPRSAPGSPLNPRARMLTSEADSSSMNARSKSLMFPPELANQLSKVHNQQASGSEPPPGTKSPPSVPARKSRPASGSNPPNPPPAAPVPDEDELKRRLANRVTMKPPAALHHQSSSPALLLHRSPPSTLSSSTDPPHPLSSSATLSPPSYSNPLMPPPPPLHTPPQSPPLTTSPEDKPPVISTPARPPLLNGPPPAVNPVVAQSSAGKQRPPTAPRSPGMGRNTVMLTSSPATGSAPPPAYPPPPPPVQLSPPASTEEFCEPDYSTQAPEDLAYRVEQLETRLASLEEKQTETNTLLKAIMDILQHNGLHAQ